MLNLNNFNFDSAKYPLKSNNVMKELDLDHINFPLFPPKIHVYRNAQ